MAINFKTYQKVRTISHLSSKCTILPFLCIQTICHLFTIIYYGTSLHRRHVISHTLKLNDITPNVSYAHVYKGFVPILIYRNKRSCTNEAETNEAAQTKCTILPFLCIQTICHLFTIIYYGTSLHRRHVISHTLKLNDITPNVSYAHVYKGFVPILIYRNKRS